MPRRQFSEGLGSPKASVASVRGGAGLTTTFRSMGAIKPFFSAVHPFTVHDLAGLCPFPGVHLTVASLALIPWPYAFRAGEANDCAQDTASPEPGEGECD